MLLAKSCHDIDWLRYLIGRPCKKVSSFGSLKHFRASERPPGAADRCCDCEVEPRCPYSAKKIYLGGLAKGKTDWPVNVLTPNPTVESLTEALREGPYGRCVYACDNDVVDNQIVNLEYEGGAVASFMMIAFGAGGRRVRIYGTRGELMGDWGSIRHFDFMTDKWTGVDFKGESDSATSGHGGGDEGVMDAFLAAVAANDVAKVLSGPDETLETHLTVFAAEQARRENRVAAL
jgi:predicted dehydrogenase